jgi:hypothetical protein
MPRERAFIYDQTVGYNIKYYTNVSLYKFIDTAVEIERA